MTTESRRYSRGASRRWGLLGAALAQDVAVQWALPPPAGLSATVGAERDAVEAKLGFALVYSGPSSGDGCPEAAAAVAREAGLSVQFVDRPDKIAGRLNGAAVLVIGGTTGGLETFRK